MYDFVIVGGGIVGLSTALALSGRRPRARILVLEKERAWATHQTGRNSGVIHSGIYYKPGSYKARFAREGNRSMAAFCQEYGIEYEICGKLIVATKRVELPGLQALYKRGQENGLEVTLLGPEEMREIEPHVRGLAGIRVPSTGIVNYKQVADMFAKLTAERGGDLCLGARVDNIAANGQGLAIETSVGTFHARFLVNCAGLHSDRIAGLGRAKTDMKIVPFRGEYYDLKPDRRHLVKHLIYPVPNPDFPFLGVHFTRMIGGGVHAGPNAVLSLKREGYRKTDFDGRDFTEVMTYPGFWKLASRNWSEGAQEMYRSLNKRAFVRNLQRLIPEIREEDLVPSSAGVRAQALLKDGRLVDDFMIIPGSRSIHVCNAPSPAATASLEIGRTLAERIPA